MLYQVQVPGGGANLDFRVGQITPEHGEVLEIKETTDISKYCYHVPFEETCIVVIRFADHEIQINASNPLMVIYRTNEEAK